VYQRNALTIIELLVVIFIIGILTALMLPALNKARLQAKFAFCQSNLHQYGVAGNTYSAENNDYFPNPHKWLYNARITGSCQWHDEKNNVPNKPENAGSLWPYLNNKDVHLCPTFSNLAEKYGPAHPYHYEHPDIPIEPQYNYSMNSQLGRSRKDAVMKISQVRRPATVFWFAGENMWTIEGKSYTVLNDTALFIRSPAYIFGKYGSECIATYHRPPGGDINKGRGNAVFVDGHVDSVSADEDVFELSRPK